MKKLFAIFLFCCAGILLPAQQNLFNKVYDIDSMHNYTRYSFEVKNTFFLLGYFQKNINYQSSSSLIIKTDSLGNAISIDTLDIVKYSADYLTHAYLHSDSLIWILGGFYNDSIEGFNNFILKLNHNTIIDTIFITDSIDYRGAKFLPSDTGFYVLNWFYPDTSNNNLTDISIYNVDLNGNIVEKWVYEDPYQSASTDFKRTKDKGFILGGQLNNHNHSDFLLLKLDSLGNQEWQYTYGTSNDELVRTGNFLELSPDGGYLMCGEEINGDQIWGVVLKVDSLGNQLWKKYIKLQQHNYIKSMRITPDGNILICGGAVSYAPYIATPPFNSVKAFLYKLSADGNTEIWTRRFSYRWVEIAEYVNSMLISEDGGIVVSGWMHYGLDYTRNDGWLVKFDSCGYTVGATPTALLAIDSTFGGKVFINHLSQDYCTAKLLLQKNDSSFIDSLSIYAYSQYSNGADPKQIQYTFTDTGTYQITLYTYAGNAIDTFTTSIFIASTDTSTNIHSVNLPLLNCAVYPNPAQNFLLLAFEQASHSHLEAVLYNASGRLVKTFALKPKKVHHQLNLDNISTGLYFLQVKHQKQILKTKKVNIVK